MPLVLLNARVANPRPSYLKSNSSTCLPGCERIGAFPTHAFQVEEIPDVDRLAFQQVEAPASESAALCHEHAFAAALRHLDLGTDPVRRAEELWRVAHRDARQRPEVGEFSPSGREARPRRDHTRGE